MIRFFGLEDSVTLLNTKHRNTSVNANTSSLNIYSIFAGGVENATPNRHQDPENFEQWCRSQGMLIEINDSDYAEPKLTVIG